MKKVTAYRCEHCGKLYLKEKACIEHENERCFKHPQRMPLCYSCKHYNPAYEEDKEEIEFYYTSPFGEESSTKMFDPHRCKHPEINCKLYNDVKLTDDITIALTEGYGYRPMQTKSKGGCEYYQPYNTIKTEK